MSPNSIILFTLLLFYLIVLKETNMLYKNKITQCFTQLHPPLWCQNFFIKVAVVILINSQILLQKFLFIYDTEEEGLFFKKIQFSDNHGKKCWEKFNKP